MSALPVADFRLEGQETVVRRKNRVEICKNTTMLFDFTTMNRKNTTMLSDFTTVKRENTTMLVEFTTVKRENTTMALRLTTMKRAITTLFLQITTVLCGDPHASGRSTFAC